MPQPNLFDLKIVMDKFENSLQEADDVDMDSYLLGYKELNKYILSILELHIYYFLCEPTLFALALGSFN